MTFFPDGRTFVTIGNFSIYWYGVLICIGMIMACILSARNYKKKGLDSDKFFDLALPVLVIGVLGARIWYVIFTWDFYKNNLSEIINIHGGGLAIHGGLIFGMLTALIVLKKQKVTFSDATDCVMPNVFLAQALGRWGNFFNQEAYGRECTREFLEGMHLPRFIINGMHINGTYWHPTFLYESVFNVIGFIIVTFIVYRIFSKNENLKNKQYVGLSFYLIWYGIGRFFIEALRTDSLMFGPIRVAQLISILFVIGGLLLYVISNKKKAKA